LRRSHNIECPACGEHTKFSVDQRKKSIDSQVPIGENRVNLS
jgi:ribosomal protein L44E